MNLKTGQSAGALDHAPAPQSAAAGRPAQRGAPTPPDRPTVLIDAERRMALDLRDVWAYRELLYFLTWRDVKVRYKQTALGALWAVLQPLLMMVIFTLIFGRLAGMPSD